MGLQGKIAVVTGGARGIGEGIARCLAEEGAKVAILDLDGDQAAATAASLANGSIGFACDVAEEREVAAGIDRVARELGGLDILVNNAGAGRGPIDLDALPDRPTGASAFMAMDQENWDSQFAQNIRTTFVASKAAIPHIKARGGGAIVNISSIAGLGAASTLPAYGAAKAGVLSLTRSLALELAPADIRVNAICPGFLWTRAWEGMATMMTRTVPQLAGQDPRDVFLGVVAQGVPLGREQTPEDIGRLAAFLSSDAARNITGQHISVDGGITLR